MHDEIDSLFFVFCMQSISCVRQSFFELVAAEAAAGKHFYTCDGKKGIRYRWVDAEEMGL